MSSRSSIQYVISATAPNSAAIGDEWYNSTTSVLYQRSLISGVVSWVPIAPAPASSSGQLLVSQGSSLPSVWSSSVSVSALTVAGLTTTQQTTDVINSLTGATGNVVHDLSTGCVFYHTSSAANFTANITNVPTTDNRTIMVVLILNQGGTPYIPNVLQIDGAAQTIKWVASTVPTGNASKIDIVAFTLLRVSGAWTVFGQLSSYG